MKAALDERDTESMSVCVYNTVHNKSSKLGEKLYNKHTLSNVAIYSKGKYPSYIEQLKKMDASSGKQSDSTIYEILAQSLILFLLNN